MYIVDRTEKQSIISIIAAVGTMTKALGKNGRLLWHIPDDMQHFKALTMNHPVIMGRKTWESLPEKFRPLPGRTNIVVTWQIEYAAKGATIAGDSFDAARTAAARATARTNLRHRRRKTLRQHTSPSPVVYILPLVDHSDADADTFFPPYKNDFLFSSKKKAARENPHTAFRSWSENKLLHSSHGSRVPAMMRAAASGELAFRSGIFSLTISATCAFVSVPTFSSRALPEPFSMPSALSISRDAGGFFMMKVNERSS